MSAVRSRLRMLERRARERSCPLCGDRGSDRVVVAHFEGEPPPAIEACPACGRADVIVIEVGPRVWTRPSPAGAVAAGAHDQRAAVDDAAHGPRGKKTPEGS